MKLRLFNTAENKIEDFIALHPPDVGLYTCGMTVYYLTHIGNLRAYVSSDVLRRTLEYAGFRVKHVMNVTDVGHMTSDEDEGEDKLEVGARREHKTPLEIARQYEEYFFRETRRINILPPTVVCRATEHIADMIALIKRLEERRFTYRTKVGVIFDTQKFPDYAKFARLDLEGQQAGHRVVVDPERKTPWDFALWVTNQPKHVMQWDSPWGRGFPGWHIECSAMSMKYLGEEFDLHTGGEDHIKIHHSNEIAQSEAATGKKFARYWFHTHFMNIENQKMSKSLNNLYTLDDLAQRGFHPLSLRWFFLGSTYRKQINFTWDALAASQTTLVRFLEKVAALPEPDGSPLPEALAAFEDAIADDLNTAKALALALETASQKDQPAASAATLEKFDKILGLDLAQSKKKLAEINGLRTKAAGDEQKAAELMMKRQEMRKQKKFKEADALRDEVLALGFVIEDTPQGPRLKPK
jgi:cysteinyl-tRNA synthetase